MSDPRLPSVIAQPDLRDSLWDLRLPAPRVCPVPERQPNAESTEGAVRLSGVVSALSYALDITEGQPEGHAARTCMIGMRIAETLGLDDDMKSALFYALQLKDLGCSSNAAKVASLFGADDHTIKRDFKTTDWPRLSSSMAYILRNVAPQRSLIHKIGRFVAIGVSGQKGAREMVRIRCERGAEIAQIFGLPDATAEAIRGLDEHWNGKGHPRGLSGEEIPLLARIAGLSQTVEVFVASTGLDNAMEMAQRRSGRWFDPELVRILLSLRRDRDLWDHYSRENAYRQVTQYEPPDRLIIADDARLDRVALGFARVVDAKSPWTAKHSEFVTWLAVGAATALGQDDAELRRLHRAGLLHDIGKLGVSSAILDKPGKLTDDERLAIQQHPAYTQHILERIQGFEKITAIAAAHHERLDGKGYHRGITAKFLSKSMRCLVVADICEALSAQRPYRDTMPMAQVLSIMEGEVGSGLCPEAFRALKFFVEATGFRANGEESEAEAA
ncbi:MAG: HD domain-containing protein [Phycisphaerales bacterium]|nr:MAG: HD domain-containing protein [Phycisphaerales bacterium]